MDLNSYEWDVEPYFLSITYEGEPDAPFWRYPEDKILQGMELIVPPDLEAAILHDGYVLDIIGTGCHLPGPRLFPIYRTFYNIPTDGVTPILAEILYVNRRAPITVDCRARGMLKMTGKDTVHLFEAVLDVRTLWRISNTRALLACEGGRRLDADEDAIISRLRASVKQAIEALLPSLLEEGILSLSKESAARFLSARLSDHLTVPGLSFASISVEALRCTEHIERM